MSTYIAPKKGKEEIKVDAAKISETEAKAKKEAADTLNKTAYKKLYAQIVDKYSPRNLWAVSSLQQMVQEMTPPANAEKFFNAKMILISDLTKVSETKADMYNQTILELDSWHKLVTLTANFIPNNVRELLATVGTNKAMRAELREAYKNGAFITDPDDSESGEQLLNTLDQFWGEKFLAAKQQILKSSQKESNEGEQPRAMKKA